MGIRKFSQEGNAQAAWIILNDPDRYPGLPLLWARAWLNRHGLTQLVWKPRWTQGDAAAAAAKQGEAGSQ
jgi:hypothetical protein